MVGSPWLPDVRHFLVLLGSKRGEALSDLLVG